jgi:hypothetical protein
MGSPAQIFSDLESFDITDEARADIMYGTAQRFLRDECGID